ncbi:MAG: InlB B-repeat-containing protein [Lachnospiraceae bacterium]|nr:InlB B-repeat-containing protein [Lachnospiraceae bacterium]
MKHTIYGISLAVITMLVVAVVMGLSGRNVRRNEMETALNAAAEQSLEQLKMKKGYKIETYQELIADFNQSLFLQMESDSDIRVEVLAADIEKGLLDVRITEDYYNILGKKEQAICRKSVILEEYTEKRPYHKVTFLVDGEVYDQYTICEGETCVQPQNPKKENKTFCYWKKPGEDQECKLEQCVCTDDLVLEAVFS